MGTTIKDVARKAGVSIATVSRVLNNSGPVDEHTKRRVVEATRELHYTPNLLGRSLSMRRSDAIGLLLPDLHGEFYSEVIRGADRAAQQHGYHLLVSSSHNDRKEIEAALRMTRGRVDGLVIMSPDIDAKTLIDNLPKSLPVVLLNCNVDDSSFDSMNIDNFHGAYQMVEHLFTHGHMRIAIICGPRNNFDASERLRGYREAHKAHHADYDPSLELDGNFSEASGYEAVKRILAMHSRPTAIFAANDSMAIGALSALREAGIRVPEETALAGFDDIPIAHYITPALTSVHVEISKLGAQAIERILHAVREKNNYQKHRTLQATRLVIRESCGCSLQGLSRS